MDKNKNNRTDLLAAGRKKLQQYRQKKDGKGSKSSGKANKPDPDVVTDESSSAAKPKKGKKQAPALEAPAQTLPTELVDSSNADVATPDLSSTSSLPLEVSEAEESAVPSSADENAESSNLADSSNADVVTPDLSTTSTLPIEVSEVESIGPSAPDESLQRSSLDDAMPTVSSPIAVDIEGTTDSGHVPVTPVGLEAAVDNDSASKEGELQTTSGEDQRGFEMRMGIGAMQEQEHSFSEPDNRLSLVDLERDVNERTQVNSGDVVEDSKMECTSSATEQNSELGSFPGSSVLIERATADSGDVDEDSKMADTSSAAEQTREHGSFPCSSMLIERAQVNSGDVGEDSKTENTSSATERISERDGFPVTASATDDSSANNADVNPSGPPSSDPEPAIQPNDDLMVEVRSDEGIKLPPTSGEVNPVSLTELAKVFQLLGEDEVRFVMAARESVTGEDFKNDGPMKSRSVEFSERLQDQLYINNYEKELISLQLCEERDVHKEFDQHRLQWSTEKSLFSGLLSDVEGKNKILSEELATCRSELDRVTHEMDKLQMEFSSSKTELERSEHQLLSVSSELADTRSSFSDLQMKNQNLNADVASLTEEKHKLEKEREDGILENEILMKELMECKSLLELSQAENANSNESLLAELAEWKGSVEALQAENSKLNEVLTSEKEERSKLEEANEHYLQENNNFSVELTESQHLVEKERTRSVEEINRLSSGKEDALTELTNCRALINDLQVESEKSMIDFKVKAQQLEQLTEENVTLSTTLDVFRAKIREFEQKSLQETIVKDSSEQSNSLEETFLKHMILDEVMKQYVCAVEAKKVELLNLFEDLRHEGIIAETKNSELTEKLFICESRIKNWMTTVGTISGTHLSEADVGQNLSTRVATSVDAAVAVIQDLQEKLDDALRNHNLLSNSYKDLTEKTKDLEERNELASSVIHKVFDNLQKIVSDSGPSTEESEDTTSEQLDHLELSNYDVFIEKMIMILHERAQLESKNREYNLELLRKMKDMEELNKRCIYPDVIAKLFEDIQCSVTLDGVVIRLDEPVSSLESVIHFLIRNLKFNEMKSIELQNEIDNLTFTMFPYEIESQVFKGSLRSSLEQLFTIQSETQLKETELHQSEQRVSTLREKLHIAVSKGKGLIQQRDSLKQSLTATSSELEKCMHELQLKDATLQETETKLKTYSEAGERMEALESELSYIRNSATALRESFLLKDSALQRIEEILEDLELPEDFHVRDIIDKIDWLAKSVSQNSFPVSNSNQTSTIERTRSYPDSISRAMDSWREDLRPSPGPGDDELKRNYEDLQNKFYGLAEQNEMLEQSLMERNNLVQRWEEVLDNINMPPQLRSLEPEDRIEWLRVALLEANDRCDSLQQDINDLEEVRGSLVADLEESQRRLADLEDALKSVADEREQLSASLEVKSSDYNKISEKAELYEIEKDKLQNDLEKVRLSLAADLEESQRRVVDLEASLKSITDEREQLVASLEAKTYDYNTISEELELYRFEKDKLKNEVDALQSKLDEKLVSEEHIHHVHAEISRLQDLVKDMLQASGTEEFDSSTSDIQCLEGLLKKLADKYNKAVETSELTHGERSVDQSDSHGELERKLEEVEGDLVRVKDERDRHEEKSESLVREIEVLEVKNQELQRLLAQEEQKTVTVKEKLNVAVRKGKSLVQVRDSMKQNIIDLTSQVERLTSEINVRENTLLEYQQKMKDLITSQEVVENKDSEIQFLKNRLEEADSELQDKWNTLSMILGALAKIDLGVELINNDPFEKMKQIEKVMHDLQVATSSAEQESRKSRRAAELLLAELNEVQERNEDLLEELSKTTMERDSAESAKSESISRLEQLSALHREERNSQFSDLMTLKSGLDQLRPGFSKIYNLLDDVLPKDLDYLYNLEASVKSLLESSDTSNAGGQALSSSHGRIRSRSKSKVNAGSELFSDSKTEDLNNDDKIIDLWRFVGSHMQDLITHVNGFEEKLQSHSKYLHEEVIHLSETVSTLHRELTSHKHSLESAKEEIAWLESTGKQKESENAVLRKYTSILYEACKSSVLEIEKSKGELIANDSSDEILSEENLSVSQDRITNMVNRLLSHVKDYHSIQAESMEVNLKEMKDTISSLQKELTEKDVQKDRICMDLVSQIKRAEAAAMSNLQELEPAKAQINDLKGQLEAVNRHCNALEQRVKELEDQEAVLSELHGKVKSLTDALAAKEQEAESLLQALDEEETQMEDLTNKITQLERAVQQKDLDLESSEAARGKALKKLSITVSKFDELHHLSETLVSEVDKLQSQLQERDSEVSFLRDEITRCTGDSLQALETDKRGLGEIQDILTWLDSVVSGEEIRDVHLDDNKIDQVHECKETLKKQITTIISELKDLRQVAQSKDDQLHIERSKVDDLMRRREVLENSLREQESRLSLHENDGNAAERTSVTSEIVEVEPMLNKWPQQGTSRASQVRSLRKVNNDQLAISIDDVDQDDNDKLEDDDDDKAHGFKSLTTSKLVPRFTRPVTDLVDGLWVTCDRTLMRQPALRLSVILYWALMHALLAAFVV
ncbi:hypothetical protein CTI12_AA068940 [Artemisia annua]|uniref:Uncharacterized protein n=1 Tax=Artemisia annua TaxID=35608 RepID=A0A2U1Q6I7_ARTAN|nr:hypothetical protein CTI12_AA068940 [Artemisia annua]